jgi:hypothetical protein
VEQLSIDRTNYDYMDNLTPSGWAWEMLRRSTRYRNSIKDLVELIRIYNDNKRRRGRDAILKNIMHSTWSLNAKTGIYLLYLDKRQNPVTHIIHNDGVYRIGIPKPEIKYCDFDIELRPQIEGLAPVRVSSFDQLNYVTGNPSHPLSPHALLELSPHHSPESVKDTIYVGISQRAGLDEVLAALKPHLKQYLDNRNRRTPGKWKYYLITYDLRDANPEITYENIANILREYYPDARDKKGNELTFDTRNSKNFHGRACALIEGEDLEKHLQKYL